MSSDIVEANNFSFDESIDFSFNQIGALVMLGYQKVFAKRFVIDFYVGAGLAIDFDGADWAIILNNQNSLIQSNRFNRHFYRLGRTGFDDRNMYSHWNVEGIASLAGISLGILLK